MIVIYHYDQTSEYYPQRFAQCEIAQDRKTIFGPDAIALLTQAEKHLQKYYQNPTIIFEKDPAVIFLT